MPPETQPARPGAGAAVHWDALIVAGGRAERLGGIDKTALVWHGRSLLEGVLGAAAGARRICVVGSDAVLPAAVLRTVERPRWGGPAAAIMAGLHALAGASEDAGPASAQADNAADTAAGTAAAENTTGADWVVVLAGDLVRADEAVSTLLAGLDSLLAFPQVGADAGQLADGLISVDSGGRRQPLLAVYRRRALVSSAGLIGTAENLSVTTLIGGLHLVELRLPDALGDDVDTPADAARLGIVLPPPPARAESP
ncbi:NTP transferase domain-containing protein [Cryobacterium sp.]|jgi:molybdopterin-guanine dinucleotide biosynthesis protein A|uniref:molybdenum cofactor guanylyltransferase n=1 Tax=Cryobacterium sp. TaxID=1926290 RepID=UPI0026025681|nr:NTP transferase domain-containing protein [Cryobacterium sp.]MCU1446860.1 molybdopterin-guanine dinucleotide biosynthesis protein [Cryobacterium sp.]